MNNNQTRCLKGQGGGGGGGFDISIENLCF